MEHHNFALDIGGTLAKIAYIDHNEPKGELDFETSKGTVHLIHRDSKDIEGIIDFLKSKKFNAPVLRVTGGGAFKFQEILEVFPT